MNAQRTPDITPPAGPLPTSLGRGEGLSAVPRYFFISVTTALVIAGLYFGRAVLMPLACAAFLAFVLDPVVTRLRRWRLPMFAAVSLVVALTLAGIAGTGLLVVRQIAALGQDLPRYQTTIREKLHGLRLVGAPSEAFQGASRVLAVVESEIDAARAALGTSVTPGAPGTANTTGAAKKIAVTRVQVDPAPTSPFRALGDMLGPLLTPLANGGLIVVLLAYMLAQRRQVSDRLVRLMGGDMHRMVNLLGDAGARVSRFLVSQLLVNLGFGAVLALGLWLIGVPAALLWGAMAAVLRFVPYLGILIAAAFPLTLAFAVDPAWDMVMWTGALIVVAELLIANIVEPLAYSGSTGVSPAAVLLSAAFWVLIWGPMGLVLATPLTVCLVVLGRHLRPLRFLELLLGVEPAFERPTMLYQRLIADDHEEAVDWSVQEVERSTLMDFYSEVGVPMLALASAWAQRGADAGQRYRVQAGTTRILEELRERYPTAPFEHSKVLCMGARHELDTLSAEMLAHALCKQGIEAQAVAAVAISASRLGALELQGVQAVVLCSLQTAPAAHARLVCRRLRQRHPSVHITLAAWSPTSESLDAAALAALGADALAKTPVEVAMRLNTLPALQQGASPASLPPPTPQHATWPAPANPEVKLRALMARTAQRAAGIFGVPLVSVVVRAAEQGWWFESAGPASWTQSGAHPKPGDGSPLAAVLEHKQRLVIADLARVPEFAVQTGSRFEGLVSFAGVPLRDLHGSPCGALAVHDAVVRDFRDEELVLLASMGEQLWHEIEALQFESAQPAAADPTGPVSASSYLAAG